MASDPAIAARIRCEECRRPWLDNARGWQAHRPDLDELAFFCPQCADREFGDGEEGS